MKLRKAIVKRGTIIPTVLFVAIFLLLMCTIMLATVSYNFNLSLNSVEKVEYRYLSFAAVNELLSDINHGVSPDKQKVEWSTFGKENPRVTSYGGRITEVWIEPLKENDKKNFFVLARTYRDSPGHGSGETVRRLVTYRPNSKSRVYVNVTDDDPDKPDPIYANDMKDISSDGPESWEKLPPVPRKWYDENGVLQSKPGEYAGVTPYISGAPDGSIYTMYTPTLDDINDFDTPMGAHFAGLGTDLSAGLLWPIAGLIVGSTQIKWGSFALNTIVTGGHQGFTVGDLAPIPQVLVSAVDDVTVSKGAVMFKHSEGSDGADAWQALPPPLEAKYNKSTGKFDEISGNYHLQGVTSAPIGFDGGVTTALFRKGEDSIYTYTEKEGKWVVTKPPGTDVLLLAADQDGTTYTQTGELKDPGAMYLLNVMLGNLGAIEATTETSKLSSYKDGKWTTIPDPPAKFYDNNGNLQEQPYPGTRGPTLSAMVGGKKGELYVVSRPNNKNPLAPQLNDTTYKYSDGRWEVVAPPPSTIYNEQGEKAPSGPGKSASSPPQRTDLGMGTQGELIIRVPPEKKKDTFNVDWLKGQPLLKDIYVPVKLVEKLLNGDFDPNKEERLVDGVYLQNVKNKKKFDLLPPIKKDDGTLESSFSQMTIGHRKASNGLGDFTIRATYF